MIRRTWWLAWTLLGLWGCGSAPPPASADLEARQMTLSLSAKSNGTLVIAAVSVLDLEGFAVTLTAFDKLLLAAEGAEAELVPVSSRYVGALDTTAVELSMILDRGGGRRIASALTLPPPFALVAPPAGASRSQPITFTWDPDPRPSTVGVDVRSDCFPPIPRTLNADTGAFTIQPADLPAHDGACDLDVEITRTWSAGAISGEFGPSSPPALSQVRTVQLTTQP